MLAVVSACRWDAATKTWSTGNLSSARMRVQGASLKAKNGTEFALIIGGLGEFSQSDGEPYVHWWLSLFSRFLRAERICISF